MRIENSAIQLSSRYSLVESRTVEESIRVSARGQQPNLGDRTSGGHATVRDVIALSDGVLTSRSVGKAIHRDDEDVPTAELRMLKLMIERLIGRKIKLVSVEKPQESEEASGKGGTPQADRRRFDVEYNYHESYYEFERTSFSASGVINTSDGKKIAFTLNINLSREFMRERNISISASGTPEVSGAKDPLIINFSGTAAQLTDARFSFDLDMDGEEDKIPVPGANSGFLAIDRNGDGKINDGGELFGPRTGNGFEELAEYDSDHNTCID